MGSANGLHHRGALARALQGASVGERLSDRSQEAGKIPLPPKAELQWWYQYYFATERGRAGYDKYRRDFAKLIWQIASPKWNFDDATFERSAASFDNPDHVRIVTHNYRWRLSLAEGESKYDELKTLSKLRDAVPTLHLKATPTVGLGASPPQGNALANMRTVTRAHRSQSSQKPKDFARAVVIG